MRVRFFVAEKEREVTLAEALAEGARAHGDHVDIASTSRAAFDPDYPVAAIFGVKASSRRVVDEHMRPGCASLVFDKALIRSEGAGNGYFRVGLNGTPIAYMMRERRPPSRWARLGIDLPNGIRKGRKVIFAGSSQKYCDWHRLGDANAYADYVLSLAKMEFAGRWSEFVYRPKPSWDGAKLIPGATLSTGRGDLPHLLRDAAVLITHGSSAAIDAVLAGVPVITMGQCAASPISQDLYAPRFTPPPDDRLREWAAALAWCQWTIEEFRSGEAWSFYRHELTLAGVR